MTTTYGAMPHITGMLDYQKYIELSRKYGSRVIHQSWDPCPQGVTKGCKLCAAAGRKGWHARPISEVQVADTPRYNAAGNAPELLSHRMNTSDRVLTATVRGQSRVLREGVDWATDGRLIRWIPGGTVPDYQTTYTVSYTAYAESWVNLQHTQDVLRRQSEKAEFIQEGRLDQGHIMMSIHQDAPGYYMKTGDTFVAVDGLSQYTRHLEANRPQQRSQHRFIQDQPTAFYINAAETAEVQVPVNYDAARQQFVFPPEVQFPDDTGITVLYRAAPVYFVWLDHGEFRVPMSQQQQRLVVLSLLETVV